VGLYMTDLGGEFEKFRGEPILSGIFSNEGIKTLDRYMMELDFMVKYKLSIRPGKEPPRGTPVRDNYLIRVYEYPPDWAKLSDAEIQHRLMMCSLQLRRMGEADESMLIFSFWPDVIMVKEVGDPITVAEYLGLNRKELQARTMLVQGRQNTNYAINIYACHPFFIQGMATTFFHPGHGHHDKRRKHGIRAHQGISHVPRFSWLHGISVRFGDIHPHSPLYEKATGDGD